MTKYERRVHGIINLKILCYADLAKNCLYNIANNTGDIRYNYIKLGEQFINVYAIVDLAYSLELVDGITYFIEAINEYINGKRNKCPVTDDFKLDEMEMI